MSFKAVTWAFDTIRGVLPQEKLVLVALAEFANDENVTWRSLEEVAARAECSVRTAKTHLKNLELRGLISRVGRYTWCDSQSEACSKRSAHKHRSGTTYTLHLNVLVPLPLPDVASKNMATMSIGAKLALVEEMPELSGKVHGCKTCTYEECECSTGATEGIPQVQQAAPICNIEPPIKPPILSNPKKVTTARENDFSAGRGWGEENVVSASMPEREVDLNSTPGEVQVNAELVMACIPEPMRTLDAVGVKRVWRVLEPLLSAGAKPGQIRDYLNSGKLPEHVNYMPGLIISRLERMALPKASTRGLSVVAPVRTNEPEKVETLVVTPEDERVGELSKRVDRACGGMRPGSLALVTNEVIAQVAASRGLERDKAVEACLALSFGELSQLSMQGSVHVRKRAEKQKFRSKRVAK